MPARSCIAVVALASSVLCGRRTEAQTASTLPDPHVAAVDAGPLDLSRYVAVGDMLVPHDPSQRPGRDWQMAYPYDPQTPVQYAEYMPVDYRPYSTWDFGIVPVEFVAEVTADERALFFRRCAEWGGLAPVMCVARTSQTTYLEVRKDPERDGKPSPCYATLGGGSYPGRRVMNMPGSCFNGAEIHELGHVFGLHHEHQRPDRDGYVRVDDSKIDEDWRSSYAKYDGSQPWHSPAWGPYDFLSVMHYSCGAADSQSGLAVLPAFAEYGNRCGQGVNRKTGSSHGAPTEVDLQALVPLYHGRLVWGREHAARFRPTSAFSRLDFLTAMERLHAFYMSRQGLQRADGLSIGGRPDFLGIAAWIFDIYLGARSAGWQHWAAFDIVVASITQTDEWRAKNPTLAPIRPDPFSPSLRFDRQEFLDVLRRLDAFYASQEGLQRSDGLSINGGPDFLGIATWVFDVYLNERLRGASSERSWDAVVRAIQRTDEWRSRHP